MEIPSTRVLAVEVYLLFTVWKKWDTTDLTCCTENHNISTIKIFPFLSFHSLHLHFPTSFLSFDSYLCLSTTGKKTVEVWRQEWKRKREGGGWGKLMCKVKGVQKTINITRRCVLLCVSKSNPEDTWAANVPIFTHASTHTLTHSWLHTHNTHTCAYTRIQAPEGLWAHTCWTSLTHCLRNVLVFCSVKNECINGKWLKINWATFLKKNPSAFMGQF